MLVLLESDTTDADAEGWLDDIDIDAFDCNVIAAKHELEFSLNAVRDEANEPCGIGGIFVSPIEFFTESQAQRLAALFVDILHELAHKPDKVPTRRDRGIIDE